MAHSSAFPALAALVVVLTGCVLAPPPSAEPGSGARPAARTAATCDDLAPPDTFDPFFTAPLTAVGAERTDERLGGVLSDAWTTRTAGGLACEWQTAESAVTEEGYSDAYQGVRLRLLPSTQAHWTEFAESGPDDRVLTCAVLYCELWTHTRTGWWLALSAERLPVESEARVTNAFDEIAARAAELPPPSAADGPHSGDAIPSTCGAQVSAARVARALGVPAATGRLDRGGGFARASLAATEGTRCTWEDGRGARLATVTVVPGGAWALAAAASAHGATADVVVRGHESPGILRSDRAGVTLDVALDGDWVRIRVPDSPASTVSPLEAATGIAIAVVAEAA